MNPVSVDMKDLLEAESGLDLEYATNLFIGTEPDEPDNCVTIYDTGGMRPQLTYNKEEGFFYDRFQLRVRNRSYLTGVGLAKTLMDVLHGRGHEEYNSTEYELIHCVGSPSFIGRDDKGRLLFVANFEAQRRES